MGTCQIIAICIIALNLLINIGLHDTPKTGKHNFSFALFGAILWTLTLYFGGFFGK